MRIVSHRRLVEFYSSEGHGDAQAALERWYNIAEKAEWKNLSDIKADFPTTDYVGNQHYVFAHVFVSFGLKTALHLSI